jgi:hypothetical protein
MAKDTGYFQDEEEWWKQFAFLTPAEQDAVMRDAGYRDSAAAPAFEYAPGGTAEDPYNWAGIDAAMNGYAPGGTAEDPYNWAGIDAAMQAEEPAEALPFNYYGSGLSDDYALGGITDIPEFTASGNLDPFDLSQRAKQINVAQDYGALMLDNILSGMAGPGAYDVSAFTPTYEPAKEVVLKGRNRIDQYKGAGGWEGYVANEIDKGATPSGAMASLRAFIENTDPDDPDLAPERREQLQSITNSLPTLRQQQGPDMSSITGEEPDFWDRYDYDTVFGTAQDLSNSLFEDPAYGYEEVGPDGKTRYYEAEPQEIKTPQMQFFDKYGIPYPVNQYDDPQYLEAQLNAEEGTTPEYRAQEAAGYQRDLQGAGTNISRLRSEEQRQRGLDQELLAAWTAAQPEPAAPRGPAFTTAPGSAGVDFDTQFAPGGGAGAGGLLPQVAGRSATEAQLPTSVMLPGRGPAAQSGGGFGMPSWSRVRDAARGATPMVRQSANGQVGLIGRREEPRPNMGQGFGVFKPGVQREDPAYAQSFFKRTPKGSKDRPIAAKDVDREAMRKRGANASKRTVKAQRERLALEERDPRLNDLARAAELYMLARAGRTPFNDAMAQRRYNASAMGL